MLFKKKKKQPVIEKEEPKTISLMEDLQLIADCYRANVFYYYKVNNYWRSVFNKFFNQVKFHFPDRRFIVVSRLDFIGMADRQGILYFSREEDKTGRVRTFKSKALFNCSLGCDYDFIRTCPSAVLKDGIDKGNLVFQVHPSLVNMGSRELITPTPIGGKPSEELVLKTIFNALWGIVTEPKRNVINTPVELVAVSADPKERPDCYYLKSNQAYIGVSKYMVPEDNIMVGKDKEGKKIVKFTPTPFGYIIWLKPDSDGGVMERVGWLYSRV